MDRRTVLKGGFVFAATSHAMAVAPERPLQQFSVDDFLSRALPSERVRYHANALVDVMAEMHPDPNGWRAEIDHDVGMALIVPNLPKRA